VEAMEPTTSCLPEDICCRWYLVLDGVTSSVFAETGFVVVAKVLALRAHALLEGDLLWLIVSQPALLFLARSAAARFEVSS
jgi:hypothetical protein